MYVAKLVFLTKGTEYLALKNCSLSQFFLDLKVFKEAKKESISISKCWKKAL